MIEKLIKLSDDLDQQGLTKTSDSIDNLIKISLMGPTPQQVEQMKSKSKVTKEHLHALLDLLGLIPVVGETADLANAALYLSKGMTPTNVLLAGLSITSMVPTLGDASKVIKYGTKLGPEVTKNIANLILRNQGKVKAVFDKFKDPRLAKYIESYIPNGSLLVKHSDKVWESVRDWMHRILNLEAKKQTEGLINPPT